MTVEEGRQFELHKEHEHCKCEIVYLTKEQADLGSAKGWFEIEACEGRPWPGRPGAAAMPSKPITIVPALEPPPPPLALAPAREPVKPFWTTPDDELEHLLESLYSEEEDEEIVVLLGPMGPPVPLWSCCVYSYTSYIS